jgi:CRP/FNR family transcriptional regulator
MHHKLKEIPLFSLLNRDEIREVLNFSDLKILKKGNFLFFHGDRVENFHILLDGQLKIYKSNSKGDEILIHRFTKPTAIAEMPFFEDLPYPASCIAEKDSDVLLIESEKFRLFLQKNPRLLYKFIASLSQKIKFLEERIENLSILSASERVDKFEKISGDKFFSMKKVEIAEELNMTPEHLSRILKKRLP